MTTPAMGTRELLGRLQRHYIKPGAPLPGGIFLPEVGWNNGGGGGGCDAIYVGFTSTSGRILVGHELKVSRADWVKEMESPGKSDPWADQCHQWFLVVSSPDIVRDGELPAGWGLMVPGRSKTRMEVRVRADHKTNHDPSWLAVRSIMARQDTLRANAIAAVRQTAAAEARREQQEQLEKARAQQMTQQEQAACHLGRALKDRGRWDMHFSGEDDPRIEQLADAVCEALDGVKLKQQIARAIHTKVLDVDHALENLRESFALRDLMDKLEV